MKCSLAVFCLTLAALQNTTRAADGELDRPKAAAEAHVMRFVTTAPLDAVGKGLGETIWLAEGHELLSAIYRLHGDEPGASRKKPKRVSRKDYLAALSAMRKEAGEHKKPTEEQIKAAFAKAVFEAFGPEKEDGVRQFRPPDAPKTEDAMIRFEALMGDVFVKFRPDAGSEFVIFQMREVGGRWLVVGEHLD